MTEDSFLFVKLNGCDSCERAFPIARKVAERHDIPFDEKHFTQVDEAIKKQITLAPTVCLLNKNHKIKRCVEGYNGNYEKELEKMFGGK